MSWLDSVKKKREEELAAKDQAWGAKLKEEQDKAAALEQKLAAMETERQTERENVEKMSGEFEQIKARLQEAEAKTTRKTDQEEAANFIEDPDKAFGQRAAPLVNLAVQNAMTTSKLLAQQQLDNTDLASNGKVFDGRLFRAWSGDIDGEARKYQPQLLTTPNAWLGIFYYLKGLRADELSNPEMRKKKYAFLEPSRSATIPLNGEEKKEEDKLTDEERHIAERMNVKPEDYLKRKKQLKFVAA